jgi:hypothetical protein
MNLINSPGSYARVFFPTADAMSVSNLSVKSQTVKDGV